LAHGNLKITAYKRMHNFFPHLSCVATLPENTLETIRKFSFGLVCGSNTTN